MMNRMILHDYAAWCLLLFLGLIELECLVGPPQKMGTVLWVRFLERKLARTTTANMFLLCFVCYITSSWRLQ